MLGVLATKAYNPAGADGLLAGNPTFFIRQCVAVLLSSVWAFVFTLGMLWLINRVTPVSTYTTGRITQVAAATSRAIRSATRSARCNASVLGVISQATRTISDRIKLTAHSATFSW